MIEKDLQDKLKTLLQTRLEELRLDIQYMGMLDVGNSTGQDNLKLNEDDEIDSVLIIKVDPCSYETPTIPDAQFNITVSLVTSSATDYNGKTYSDITDKLESVFQYWQKTYTNYHEDFLIENKFEPTGYQLTGGAYSLDKDKYTWTYVRTFTLYGIILN